MSTQVTVTLPDETYETYRRAAYLARLTGRAVSDVLAETIGLPLQPLGAQQAGARPVADLSDEDVLALADTQRSPAQERRFGDLLDEQQAGYLAEENRHALLALMQAYQDGLLRKAQALHEAVSRGLRPPLES